MRPLSNILNRTTKDIDMQSRKLQIGLSQTPFRMIDISNQSPKLVCHKRLVIKTTSDGGSSQTSMVTCINEDSSSISQCHDEVRVVHVRHKSKPLLRTDWSNTVAWLAPLCILVLHMCIGVSILCWLDYIGQWSFWSGMLEFWFCLTEQPLLSFVTDQNSLPML